MVLIGYRAIEEGVTEVIRSEYPSLYNNLSRTTFSCQKIFNQKLIGRYLLYKLFDLLGYNQKLLDTAVVNDFGKPHIPGSGIYFNLSHSHQRIAAIISDDNEVGIDIEKIRPVSLTGFQNFFSSSDWKIIQGADDPSSTLLRYWTIKEAVLKCIGTGFSGNQEVEVSENSAIVSLGKLKKYYHYKTITIDQDYFVSFASQSEISSSVSIKQF